MRPYVAALALALALAACSADDSHGAAEQDSPSPAPSSPAPSSPAPSSPAPSSTFTLPPPPPLSGTLTAELQQSSRDVALGRFQVWITNGLERRILPRRIVYRDGILSRPVLGGRLRPIPSGSFRGYTLDLIRPRCGGGHGGHATVTVDYGRNVMTIPVEDETKVTGRWAEERCAELAIDKVAALEWSGVRVEGRGADAIGIFQLTATPTGRGGSFTVDTVGGTPLYTSAEGNAFEVHQTIRGAGRPVTMDLRAQPARCDIHAFGSATGGTTFFVNVTIGGEPAQIRLAMSPELTDETYAYAGEVCGF